MALNVMAEAARSPNVRAVTIYDRPFGRYLEDFEVGDIYKHWPGKTITEADDHLFCMISRCSS
jgi:acyl dehydratase